MSINSEEDTIFSQIKYATPWMMGKAMLQFVIWVGLYALIISNIFQGWSLFLVQIAFYCTMFLVSVGFAQPTLILKPFTNPIYTRIITLYER